MIFKPKVIRKRTSRLFSTAVVYAGQTFCKRMLLIAALMCCVSIANAQDKKVTLHAVDKPLSAVLADLSKQTKYKFFYSDNVTDPNLKVTLNVTDQPLKSVLEQLFKGKDVGFLLKKKQILLFKKSDEAVQSAENGIRKISGTVTDHEGKAIIGASVIVKNTGKGITTDMEGKYKIDVPENSVLQFSYIGFESKEILVKNSAVIDIRMKETSKALDEVVVVGYGTQRKKDLTSSIVTVSADEIANLSVSNVASALQGRMSGVQITKDGTPGGSPTIRIRGTGSINNSSPLFVVDGMIVDNIDYLGQNDIESVSVLKDASASAIYGVRAANGVIMVTTKKGVKDGTINVFVNSYAGIKTPSNLLRQANGEQYVTLYNEKMDYLGSPENKVAYSTFNTSTNWVDEVTTSSFTNSDDISIQGGTEKSSYNVGVNYLKEDGLIKDNTYNRLGMRANYDFKVSKHVKTGLNFAFTSATSKPYNGDLLVQAFKGLPIMAPKNADGTFVDPISLAISVGQSSNPAATLYYNHQWNNAYNALANFYLDVNLLKNLSFKTTLGFNPNLSRYISFTPTYDVGSFQKNTTNSMSKSRGDNLNTSWDNTLTYETTIHKDHNIKAMVGYSYRIQTYDNLYASASGLVDLPEINQSFLFLSLGKTDSYAIQASDGGGKTVQIGYMSRLNYDYKHKYLLNVTMRADGSSRFPSDNRWGYFPSVGMGWVISQEPFMQNFPAINFLKLRGGWGLLGNDNIPSNIYNPVVDNSDYRSVIFGSDQNSGNGAVSHAATVSQSYNPNLKWETVDETNIGLDITTLNNRLSGAIDWYYKMTTNAIFSTTALGSSGIDPNGVWGNYADILNTGIELSAGWQDKINDKFSYSLNANFTYNKNEMNNISAAGASYYDCPYSDTPTITRTAKGHSIGEFFGYKAIGVFQNAEDIAAYPHLLGTIPGDLIFKDMNGDKNLDAADRTYLGNPNPPFIYGFNIGLKYENLDFNMFCQGVAGNKIFNANRMLRYQTENYDLNFYNNRWHGEGTSNSYPSAVMSNPTTPNSFYVESGSYFRLKTIQLGYTLPFSTIKALGVQKARLYVNAENPLTIFGYNGYSPEVSSSNPLMSGSDRGVYPLSSIYCFGVNLVF
ncbi:MAG: TonB-dependent receptor [Bacteroidales bacterium]|nr:TonB-dependent receptor [Bacteroidales bacterium]MDD3906911.1 TonB-dependent receptor [Bacteroidales bacterium]MDD4713411.1 TonB-dependent receptor [Bacteroidales bacterium]